MAIMRHARPVPLTHILPTLVAITPAKLKFFATNFTNEHELSFVKFVADCGHGYAAASSSSAMILVNTSKLGGFSKCFFTAH